MYDALSALPLLESLTLPNSSGLDRLAGLPCAGRLQVLRVQCGRSADWRVVAMGISGLQQLRKLQLDTAPPPDDQLEGFRALLRRLPPTLLEMTLGVYCGPGRSHGLGVITVGLQDGRALRLGLGVTSGACMALYHFAELLLGWPALEKPQRQLLMSLDCLTLPYDEDEDGHDPIWWVRTLEWGPVKELVRRCLRVELGELRVEERVPKWVVLRAMGLLGKPGRLVLQAGPHERATLDIRRASEEPELPAAGTLPPLLQQWRRRHAEHRLSRLTDRVLRRTFAAQEWEEDDEPPLPPIYVVQQALQQFWDKRLMVGAGPGVGDSDSSASSSSDGEDVDDPDEPSNGSETAAGGGAGGLDERARLAIMLRLWKKLVLK